MLWVEMPWFTVGSFRGGACWEGNHLLPLAVADERASFHDDPAFAVAGLHAQVPPLHSQEEPVGDSANVPEEDDALRVECP